MEFTHLDKSGKARMVDVSAKGIVKRTATAEGEILLAPSTLELIRGKGVPKGDVLTVAKIAGIQAAKKTSEIIPLCHPLLLDQIDLTFKTGKAGIVVTSTVICTGRTGVEMEALSAVSGALLAIYDMCKAVDKTMVLNEIRLVEKTKEAL